MTKYKLFHLKNGMLIANFMANPLPYNRRTSSSSSVPKKDVPSRLWLEAVNVICFTKTWTKREGSEGGVRYETSEGLRKRGKRKHGTCLERLSPLFSSTAPLSIYIPDCLWISSTGWRLRAAASRLLPFGPTSIILRGCFIMGRLPDSSMVVVVVVGVYGRGASMQRGWNRKRTLEALSLSSLSV